MQKETYQNCVETLKRELLPAMGCTEPIAVAFAAALARKTLGKLPEEVTISVSGNILKNVKSVVVPNTGGMRGVISAAAAGIAVGDPDKELEVLSTLTDKDREEIKRYISAAKFNLEEARRGQIFDIGILVRAGEETAYVRITERHTNVVYIEKNGKALKQGGESVKEAEVLEDGLTVEEIVEFAENVNLDDVRELIERQLKYNLAISDEGLKGDYGARVGKTILSAFGKDIHTLAKARAAAGSDARMNGCALPVVIVSGSGNQGITASVPVATYAEYLGSSHEKLLRAVILSDLVTVHLKSRIGRLSAYCGVVSAGCGAAAGICYLHGGKYEEIARTIVNALAIDSGIVCDGAKSSCAAKIASSIEAGLVGFEMCRQGNLFHGGDGIIESGVENTIRNVGDLASRGMRETDAEIIRMMIKNI